MSYENRKTKSMGEAPLTAASPAAGSTGPWMDCDGGLLSAMAYLTGAATSVTVRLEFSNTNTVNAPAVLGDTYTLTQAEPADGTTFDSTESNWAYCRLRITAITGVGEVRGLYRYRENS